jgi:dolichol-phosphate mannosyltransferase
MSEILPIRQKENCVLTIAIPAYLEEENLRIVLPRLSKTLMALPISFEIVVVDTQTPMDNTRMVCQENNVVCINRLSGNNYGDAVRTAIEYCTSPYLLFMDGDGSHAPEFIPNFLKFADSYDVVIASRYVKGGSSHSSKHLVFMSKVVNVLYSVILNLNCKDVSNSFKLYRTALLKPLTLYSKNFDILEEILFKMKRNCRKLRVLELPFKFKDRMFGHTKRNLFVFILTYLYTLLKLRFGK